MEEGGLRKNNKEIIHSIQCNRLVKIVKSFNMFTELNIGRELVVVLRRVESPIIVA